MERCSAALVPPNQSHPWGLLTTCGAHLLGCPCGDRSGFADMVLCCQCNVPSCSLPSPLLARHSLFSSMLSWGLRPCIFHPGASGCSPAPVPLPWRVVVARAPREPPSREGGPGARSAPGAARRSSPAPTRPPSRGSAISCCVATDLRAKSQRGPRARGTASCLRPLPPLAQGTGRASPGALRGCSPAPWPEHSAAGTSVLSASVVPVQGVKVALVPAEEMASVTQPWDHQP